MADEGFIKRVEEHAHKIGFRDGMKTNDAIYIILADLWRLQDQINDIVKLTEKLWTGEQEKKWK